MALAKLPPSFNQDDVEILKKTNEANIALSELNGLIFHLPSYELLLKPLTAREAVASSEIENIRTTTLDILQAEIVGDVKILPQALKETLNYKEALLYGYELIKHNGFIATNDVVAIQRILEPNKPGIRNTMGTVIADRGGNIIYTPPQIESEIRDLMQNLDEYVNDKGSSVDPLIKLAILHYQFESIHPFFDGNGRTGRILMVLYLYLVKRLRYPVLFLSGYILQEKETYYRLLQEIRTKGSWKEWVLFILQGVTEQSKETCKRIQEILEIKKSWKQMLKKEYPQLYSIEVLDYLFSQAFYTQTNMSRNINLTRPTVIKYLELLLEAGRLRERKVGKERLFFIPEFIQILS